MSQAHDSLLRQAIELAQANKRVEARQLILKVVTQDEENARAWMLLARVTPDLNERRTALMNVVNLEPFNTKAQQALAELEGKMAISRAVGDDPEKRSRGRRIVRVFLYFLLTVMTLIIVGVLILVMIKNNERKDDVAEVTNARETYVRQTSVAALAIEATATAVQQAIVDITSTYVAFPTLTFTPRPTLPPENTSTPTVTPTASLTPIASPQGLTGQIIGWGGRLATEGETDFPIIFISVTDGAITQVSGSNRGQNVTAINTSRVIYQRYFRDVFRSELSKLDAVSGISEAMSNEWDGTTLLVGETQWPHLTPDGRMLVFSATSPADDTLGIYLYDTLAAGEKLRRLTADGNNYTMPTISPDGTRIVAVRSAKSPNPPSTDLVLIDVASGTVEDWTTDGDTTVETTPRWSPDGKLVAYVVVNAETGNGDILLRTTEGIVNVFPVTRTPETNEIFPVFSPDSRYMAYSSDIVEGYNIFIYDLLTNAFFQLTFDDEAFYPGVWLN
ncbi:MAG: PD40 domain-containing protein [Chloroflexi bacterium]|nr:PD40 domain-containing protein [Chloroflexota bacterium]